MSLGASAAAEWDVLVTTAVVGTDRRPPPPPAAGWDTWVLDDDPAVAVLDRAAAVVTARRAGALPLPGPAVAVPRAPDDPRPPCPPLCAARLGRLLSGEHTVVMAEWFALADRAGVSLPWEWLPTLLLRSRRDPALDAVVRRAARGRAEWLAQVVPELGVTASGSARQAASLLSPPPPPADSRASAGALVAALAEGRMSWTMVPHVEQLIASLEPAALPALVAALAALPFDPGAERVRTAAMSLAEARIEMQHEFAAAIAAALAAATMTDAPDASVRPEPPATRPATRPTTRPTTSSDGAR